MGILARSDIGRIKEHWSRLGMDPQFSLLRGPETGLVMVRGCINGTGKPFNAGEAAVTRATVKLEDGRVGHAMVLGRDQAKARLCAVIDALCQDASTAETIEASLIAPLTQLLDDDDDRRRAETAATRVNFFTMVRGEDA